MNHLDLFSGIGGFALAAKWAGFFTVAFVEKDLFCQSVLKKHWSIHTPRMFGDIKEFDYQKICGFRIELLTAGFPCQPFSVAGKRKGKDDDRYLWPDTIRIIRECQPNWLILENVPGIISCLDSILEDLEREDYTWRAYLIPASAIGAPHKRERLWIIAHAMRERCNDRINHWEARYVQENINRYMEAIQQKWPQCIYESWKTYEAEHWIYLNASISRENNGLPDRVDRCKALGNSIVPQMAYLFMKMIKDIENDKELFKR